MFERCTDNLILKKSEAPPLFYDLLLQTYFFAIRSASDINYYTKYCIKLFTEPVSSIGKIFDEGVGCAENILYSSKFKEDLVGIYLRV